MKKKKLSGKLILGKHKISSFASSKIMGRGPTDPPIIDITAGGGNLPAGCESINVCGPAPSGEGTPSICICQ